MTKSVPIPQPPRRLVGQRPRTRQRGQSIVEFALVLPVMLAIVGVVIDAARLYQVWVNLESATRDAAQYLATSSTDPTAPDYTWAGEDADTKAAYILTTATGYEVERSLSADEFASCDTAQVTTTYWQDATTQNGGTVSNPVSTATVSACIPFRTLFNYPFLATEGDILLHAERTMSVIVGR